MNEFRYTFEVETLWTRPKAEPRREVLEQLLDHAQHGDTVVIDMTRLEAFDYSFAAEFFSKSLQELPIRHPGVFLVIEGLGEFARDSLKATLKEDDQVVIVRSDAGFELLGDFHPADAITLQAVLDSEQPATAASLSAALGISVNAANERLTKMVNSGLVRRVETISQAGRKQFTYRSLS